MFIKYEFKRAFSHTFILALALGVLSGIGGCVSYYFDSQWNEPVAISCYEAWLYCLSISEASIYRAIFPVVVCLPYLGTFHTDRNSSFIFCLISRTSYLRYLGTKIFVGMISAIIVIVLVLVVWFLVCFLLFPHNLPTTIVNYIPKGAFSQFYVIHPIKYIGCIVLLNAVSTAVIYLFSMTLTFWVKNSRIVVLAPFIVYLFLIFISQTNTFSILDPIPLVTPLESSRVSFEQIAIRLVIVLIISCVGIYFSYKVDNKEIL